MSTYQVDEKGRLVWPSPSGLVWEVIGITDKETFALSKIEE